MTPHGQRFTSCSSVCHLCARALSCIQDSAQRAVRPAESAPPSCCRLLQRQRARRGCHQFFAGHKATGDTQRARGSRRPTAGRQILEGGGRRPLGCSPQQNNFRKKQARGGKRRLAGRYCAGSSRDLVGTFGIFCCQSTDRGGAVKVPSTVQGAPEAELGVSSCCRGCRNPSEGCRP